MGIPVALYLFHAGCQKRGLLRGCDPHRNCGMVVILLCFLYNYGNLTLTLHQVKRSHPVEGWLFIGKFKVGSVSEISVALKASKNGIKIHNEYDTKPLIKSYNCY